MIKTLFFFKHPKLQVAVRCWGLEVQLWFVLFSLFLRNLKIKEITSTQGRNARNTAHVVTSRVDCQKLRDERTQKPDISSGGTARACAQTQNELVILWVCLKCPWEELCEPQTFSC